MLSVRFDNSVNSVGAWGDRTMVANWICVLAKATDENLTSENWEYILVWILMVCVLGWERCADVGCRMFVIKSLRRNLGMLYFVYRIMYEFDTDF